MNKDDKEYQELLQKHLPFYKKVFEESCKISDYIRGAKLSPLTILEFAVVNVIANMRQFATNKELSSDAAKSVLRAIDEIQKYYLSILCDTVGIDIDKTFDTVKLLFQFENDLATLASEQLTKEKLQ